MRIIPNTWQPQVRSKQIPSIHNTPHAHKATSYDRTRRARHHTRAPGRFTTNQGALDMCTPVSASLASQFTRQRLPRAR